MIDILELKSARDAAYASYEMLTELVDDAASANIDLVQPMGEPAWGNAWTEGRESSPYYVAYMAAQQSYYSLDAMYMSHPKYETLAHIDTTMPKDWQGVLS